jgi:hypothetical protein
MGFLYLVEVLFCVPYLGKVPSFGLFVHCQWGFSRGKLVVVTSRKNIKDYDCTTTNKT